jgi:hypothetical protein
MQAVLALAGVAAGDDDRKGRVGACEGVLPGLAGLLAPGVRPELQVVAAAALLDLLTVGCDEVRRLAASQASGVLPALVAALGPDCAAAVHGQAAGALMNMAGWEEPDVKEAVADYPGALRALVRLLGPGKLPAVQAAAAGVLWNLAQGSRPLRRAVAEEPGAVEALQTLVVPGGGEGDAAVRAMGVLQGRRRVCLELAAV